MEVLKLKRKTILEREWELLLIALFRPHCKSWQQVSMHKTKMLKLSSIFLLTCVLCLLCYINLSSVKNRKVSFYSLVAKSCVVAILIWKSQLQASCSIPQGQKASGPNSCLCVTVVNWWAFLNNWPKPRKLSDCGDTKLDLSSSHAPRGDVLPHVRACLRKL